MGRVFSYCRCSTTIQDREGADSFSRQELQAREWCERNGAELDPMDLSDVGVSAFRGKNLAGGGVLDRFLALARSGQLGNGPTLLVEDMDRFSRASPITVFPKLLQDVVDAGVTLVVLRDGLTINRSTLENDIGTWYRLLGGITAAHDFSKKLSDRVSSAKKKERLEIADGVKRRKGVTPYWIRWCETDQDFVLIDKEVDLIRRVFDLSIDRGYGCARIARSLREEGTKTTTGKGYTTGTIHKLVTNIAVTGLYQPHVMKDVVVEEVGERVVRRRAVPDGDPVLRYPAVIDAERFALAQEKLKGRQKSGGARTRFRSPLQGRIRCLHSGDLMAYTPAIRGGILYEYLRPGHAAKGTFAEKGSGGMVNYQSILAAVLTGLSQTTWEGFLSDSDSEDELQRELARLRELEDGLTGMKAQHQNLLAKVGEAAADGAALSLLKTLQDSVDLKGEDIEEREVVISRTTARIAELRHHPMADAWPQLREQITELMKVFGRGHDTEVERARLNGLLVSHGIEITVDTKANRIGFTVNGRCQWQSYDPDAAVIQLWSGLIWNQETPAEKERFVRQVDVVGGQMTRLLEEGSQEPTKEMEELFNQLDAMEETWVGNVLENPGDVSARAKEIRAAVSRQRMDNRA